jgi:hypothetical protein
MATYDSTVNCTGVALNGSFVYTPPNPPTSPNGSLGGTYTLDDGTALTMANPSASGSSVQFSITPTTGTTTYSFNGAYTSASGNIVGRTAPCSNPQQDDDNWTASAQ